MSQPVAGLLVDPVSLALQTANNLMSYMLNTHRNIRAIVEKCSFYVSISETGALGDYSSYPWTTKRR